MEYTLFYFRHAVFRTKQTVFHTKQAGFQQEHGKLLREITLYADEKSKGRDKGINL